MKKKYVTLDDFKKEQKKREFKERMNKTAMKVKEFFDRNKEVIITVVPIGITGVTTIVKVVGRRINLRKSEELKDLYCYDRSLGHYWRLRRELSNKEWLEIDKRKRNGEKLSDILDEMKVLK